MGPNRIVLTLVLVCPLALAACGGTRQDASEPSGTFDISIVRHSFPARQALAAAARMEISVRNDGSRTVPDVAVTVNSFSTAATEPSSCTACPPLSDPNRPVWIVNTAPEGGQTAYTNTWALGPLAPGATRTFVWDVTAVVPGPHTISYRVAAGLNGKARAQLTGGGIPEGSFRVNVSSKAPQSRVDPNTGRVIRSAPAIAGGGRGAAATPGPQGTSGRSFGTQGSSSQQSGSGSGSQPGG